MGTRFTAGGAVSAALILCFCSEASATELIHNGNFESKSLVGWQTANRLEGTFGISAPGADTPITGSPTQMNPSGGLAYAVSDQDIVHGGANVLFQDIQVPAGSTSLSIHFQMFVTDWAGFGPIVDPSGLDPTTGGLVQPRDNQHARVDLIGINADPFSNDNVIQNLYLGTDPNVPADWTTYNFSLKTQNLPTLMRLRFADVANLAPMQMGVDNVSVDALIASVPEPTTFTVLALGVIPALRRRIARRA